MLIVLLVCIALLVCIILLAVLLVCIALLAVLLLAFFVDLSPVILIVCSGVVGYVARMIAGMKKGGADQ